MKKPAFLIVLTLALAGLVFADHQYSEVGSVHDIMEVVQGPSMKYVTDMMKAGGPQNDDDWKHAKAHVSIVGESTQLLLMGARVKDEPWTSGALKAIAGAQEAVAAADAKDAAAFRSAMGNLGAGCRTCHKVYKKEKK
jgi:cytochrome c556